MAITTAARFRGCLLGLAVGDAVGTTVEFRPRGRFQPLTDMIGGGPFQLEPGQWTDDTAMALCLAASLVELGHFDPDDQMRRYVRWWQEGYMSCTGACFDIGNTVRAALQKYLATGQPYAGSTDTYSAGNGCLMRLAPVPMFFYPNRDAILQFSGDSSRTTHGASECVEASRLFGAMLYQAFSGADKDSILVGHGLNDLESPDLRAVAQVEYRDKSVNEIRGTGYVVASLEAALWCFHRTDNFRDAILAAANLGDDADTTAAICGQIAGAYYGDTGIPGDWLERLAWAADIAAWAERLHPTA